MSEEEYEKMSASEKKKEDWMNSKWRPMMGWLYMSVCAFDFVLFPILWSVLQAYSKGQVNVQWQPLTLQGAGLFHVAMGAVLGLAAWGRTQEKLNGVNNGGAQIGTTYTPPAAPPPLATPAPAVTPTTSSFPSFGSGSATASSGQIVSGFNGKPAPVQPPDPVR